MLSTVDLLDVAKHKQGDVSDYRLAKILGINPNAISNYRAGRSAPENPIAMRLAALCGLDPVEVVAWVNIERNKSEADREFWSLVLNRIQGHDGRH